MREGPGERGPRETGKGRRQVTKPDGRALCQAPCTLHLILCLQQPPPSQSWEPEGQGGEGTCAQENAAPPGGESRPGRAVMGVDLELLLLPRVTVTRLKSKNSSKVPFWVSISLTWGVLFWGQLKGRRVGSDPDFPWQIPALRFSTAKRGGVWGRGTVNPFTASFWNSPKKGNRMGWVF